MPKNAKFAIDLKSFCASSKISPQQSALLELRAKSKFGKRLRTSNSLRTPASTMNYDMSLKFEKISIKIFTSENDLEEFAVISRS